MSKIIKPVITFPRKVKPPVWRKCKYLIKKYIKIYQKNSTLEHRYYFMAFVFFIAFIPGWIAKKFEKLEEISFEVQEFLPQLSLFIIIVALLFLSAIQLNNKHQWFSEDKLLKGFKPFSVLIGITLLTLIPFSNNGDGQYFYEASIYIAVFFSVLGAF
ncbi:hypothetical protein [Candidatus Thioglobus sp.]|uniref:hypothetical protein n=1 Tax=Candidatus Thioglobus sp. TaxID=2026721 RepID=UPI003D104A89